MKNVLTVAASAALLSGIALAQVPNDECAGAIPIVNGPNGPFTNSGATTSVPAWPCGAGGIDVWFSYVATCTGSIVVNTCGGSYDSTLEVFTACGGSSIVCNDDSCGLQSQVTFAAIQGQTYFIRMGGFASSIGSAPLTVVACPVTAVVTNYGPGCVACPGSAYELFPVGGFDLNGASITHVGGAVFVVGTNAYVPPGAGATTLALADDSEVTIVLGNPFPLPCNTGVATTMTVCSNGFVSTATNGTSFTPQLAPFLNAANTSWRCWHDFNPAAGGAVKHEIVGTSDVISWEAVRDFGGTNVSTWQIVFDASGSVEWRFSSMSAGGNAFLLGYSPAGTSLDPGTLDWSAIPFTTVCCTEQLPLALAASGRPLAGTNVSLTTTNIPASAAFGAILLGFTQFNPGIPIPVLPGCLQHNDAAVSAGFFLAPSSTMVTNLPFLNPVPAAYVGTTIQAQAAVYTGGFPFAITSNGVSLTLGSI